MGRSLGISLVPRKVCPYDCVHCTLGPTTDLTLDRKSYITPDEVQTLVAPVLRHRLILEPEAEIEGFSADDYLKKIIEKIKVPR